MERNGDPTVLFSPLLFRTNVISVYIVTSCGEDFSHFLIIWMIDFMLKSPT